jgi:transposase
VFVRQKRNSTGSISVQVIDKSSGRYRVLKTIGSSSDKAAIKSLVAQGKQYILTLTGQSRLDFLLGDDIHFFNSVYENIQNIQLLGPELVLGRIFDEIGFNKINDELFRHLVIARLIYPVSKLKTLDYLLKYKGIVYEKDQVYRYLDKLHKEQISQVQQISYHHTVQVLNTDISIVFYDVTTLYFESEDEDELRKTGFSKDGKHQQPQIVLGLLVSAWGYPLDYEIFEGNKFEGHTMLPVIEAFKKKHQLQQLIIVADAGLMSNKNIEQLLENNYQFIIGARVKNETHELQKKILSKPLKDGESISINKTDNMRLIISFSSGRASKDEHNRKRGLFKLEKALQKGKLTKQHINNKGYNKYLKLTGEVRIEIDYEKFNADKKWDGLKGYITNTQLDNQTIIEHYKQLWHIEKTFRISKTDLRIRPIYHQLKRRIEAHICIAFAACKIYKELERQLKEKKSALSPEKTIDILKTIYGINLKLPQSKLTKLMLLDKTQEQKDVLSLFKIS